MFPDDGSRILKDYVAADVNDLAAAEETTLRKIAAPVNFPLTKEDKEDIADLVWKFDSERDGIVGLAAPQIGVSKRIIVIKISSYVAKVQRCRVFSKTVWINPSFFKLNDEMEEGWEQCFSVKDYVGQVMRYKSIIYEAFHEDGRMIKGRADGFAARVIQHEIDHLDGKLFLDYIPREKLVTTDQYMKMFHKPSVRNRQEYVGPSVSLKPWK